MWRLRVNLILLAEVFKTYLPPEYPYDVVGGERNVKVADFDDKVDILPVADPNIFSQAQRITMAQTELQLAQSIHKFTTYMKRTERCIRQLVLRY